MAVKRRKWVQRSFARIMLALVLAFACALAACGEKRVVGKQCESPLLDGPGVYGTSCAPCEDATTELDERGCPIFVTHADCGGDICLGGALIPMYVPPDASTPDGSLMDAGEESDAGD